MPRVVVTDKLRWRSTAVPVRVQWYLTALPAPPPLMTAPGYRAEMTIRFAIGEQVTGTAGLSTTA